MMPSRDNHIVLLRAAFWNFRVSNSEVDLDAAVIFARIAVPPHFERQWKIESMPDRGEPYLLDPSIHQRPEHRVSSCECHWFGMRRRRFDAAVSFYREVDGWVTKEHDGSRLHGGEAIIPELVEGAPVKVDRSLESRDALCDAEPLRQAHLPYVRACECCCFFFVSRETGERTGLVGCTSCEIDGKALKCRDNS